jgi:hypothetical protein
MSPELPSCPDVERFRFLGFDAAKKESGMMWGERQKPCKNFDQVSPTQKGKSPLVRSVSDVENA